MPQFDLEDTLAKVTEAYLVHEGIAFKRRFTDAELADATARVGEALEAQKPLELSDLSPHCKVRDA